MIAIQADTRLTPPQGSAPTRNLDIKPREEGQFPRVQRMLKMQSAPWFPGFKGLEPAPAGRRWLVYSFTPRENVAARNPELGNTKWESWLQASRADGFFELWSGTLGELLAQI